MNPRSSTPRSTAIRMTGGDALGLLHRISTQALLDLAPAEGRVTLFCDFRGRLLHRATVYLARDGAVWLLRDDAPGAELAAFVDRFVFRDDVALHDRSTELPVTLVTGALLSPSEEAGTPIVVVAGDEAWRVGGAEVSAPDERGRIESGRPAQGHEIVEEFNPFEVGLGGAVHLEKGCYTGQEALQRLVTYRSVRRRLARVAGEGSPPGPPAELTWRDARAGWVTSAVQDGDANRWIGLAVVKVDCLDSGETPTLGGVPLSRAPQPLEVAPPARRS